MRILFLDDDDIRHKHFIRNTIGCVVDQAWNAKECLLLLHSNVYDYIFLDHDLSPEHYDNNFSHHYDGRYVARELIKLGVNKEARIFIHSLNGKCADEMVKILHPTYEVARFPYAWKMVKYHHKHLDII